MAAHLEENFCVLEENISRPATSYLVAPMPILELPPNPTPLRDPNDPAGDGPTRSVRVRSARFGDLEEHELIHLVDSIDDELSKSRFRESIYISTIVCLAVAWFLLYGPRVLFHQPEFQDPIALLKQHDKELTYITPRTAPPIPVNRAQPDRQMLKKLDEQPRPAPPAPSAAQPPAPQPTAQQAPPQEQARTTTAPPVNQPSLPLPAAPSRQPALPDAPRPTIAQNTGPQTARDQMQQAMRDARGRSGAEYGTAPGASGPLQAGATILSDTMGVDFSDYMRRLHHDIQRNWDPLIPEEVQPPLLKKGIVGIRFSILPNGQIGAMTLEFKSGDVALDKAAWFAITSEGNFPPLPKEFRGPQLELRVGFFYNTPIQ
jgi:hypothetical protein